MLFEIYDLDIYKNIDDAHKDGATTIMDIPFECISTMYTVLDAVLSVYGKKEIGIRLHTEEINNESKLA